MIRRVVEEEQKVLSSIISFDIARINTKKEKKKKINVSSNRDPLELHLDVIVSKFITIVIKREDIIYIYTQYILKILRWLNSKLLSNMRNDTWNNYVEFLKQICFLIFVFFFFFATIFIRYFRTNDRYSHLKNEIILITKSRKRRY